MTHETEPPEHRARHAYADIYGLMVARHQSQRLAALKLLGSLERRPAAGLAVPSLTERVAELTRMVEAADAPPREWIYAIGLSVESRPVRGKKHSGIYKLSVLGADNPSGFKLEVTGPSGMVLWWPECGWPETEIMVRAGCWRHPARRFFGLRDDRGPPKTTIYSRTGEAPPPKEEIPLFPKTIG